MKRGHLAIIIAGLVASIALGFISIYLTGIGVIIVIAVAMSFQIMQDSETLTDLVVVLSENAKVLTVKNRGNTRIQNIVVSLIPLTLEFHVPELAVDGIYTYELPEMIIEAKAVVDYEDRSGKKYQKSFQISSLHDTDDLLKPVFPIFGWKEK